MDAAHYFNPLSYQKYCLFRLYLCLWLSHLGKILDAKLAYQFIGDISFHGSDTLNFCGRKSCDNSY